MKFYAETSALIHLSFHGFIISGSDLDMFKLMTRPRFYFSALYNIMTNFEKPLYNLIKTDVNEFIFPRHLIFFLYV